jgi:hypothetical protein
MGGGGSKSRRRATPWRFKTADTVDRGIWSLLAIS